MPLDTAAAHRAIDDLASDHTRQLADAAATEAILRARIAELEANERPDVPDVYEVQAGDTLLKIGRRYLVQVHDIKAWNRLTSDTIHPRQRLHLTGPAPAPGPDPVPVPVPDPQPQPEPLRRPFVRFVNWWCADGWRDGRPEEHHLDEHGVDSPEVAAYRALVQRTSGTEWSFDTSALGRDANRAEDVKIDSHRTLLSARNVRWIRVFFGSAPPTWTGNQVEHKRIAALVPGDTFLFSSLSTDWAAWRRFYEQTPDQFRGGLEPIAAFGHEREADLDVGPRLRAWLDGNARVADLLNDAEGYTTDHLAKIGLYYSQEVDKRAGVSIPNREQLYGGQDFGLFGEDVYNPRAATGYRTAAQLVGPILAFAKEVGRPTCIPELGGVRKAADPTGEGRAKMIRDIAAYIDKANAAA